MQMEFLLDSQGNILDISNDGITVFDGRSFTTYHHGCRKENELGGVESIYEE